MRNVKAIALAAALAVALAGSAALFSADASAAATYEARVYIDEEEHKGTGTDLESVVKSVTGDDLVIAANYTILSYKGQTAPEGKAWILFKWVAPKTWKGLTFDKDGELENGVALAIHLSDVTVVEGKTKYSEPGFKPVATASFFIQFREDYGIDYVQTLLTENRRKAGFWVSGSGSNVAEAFSDACRKYDFQLDMNTGEGGHPPELIGWIASFMTLEDEYDPVSKVWKYWTQWSWGGSAWKLNGYTLGHYDPGVTPHVALVRQSGNEAPDAVPAEAEVLPPSYVWGWSTIAGTHAETMYREDGGKIQSESTVTGAVVDGVYTVGEAAVTELIGQLDQIVAMSGEKSMNVTVDVGGGSKASVHGFSGIGAADVTVRSSFGTVALPKVAVSGMGAGTFTLEYRQATAADLTERQREKVGEGDTLVYIAAGIGGKPLHDLGGDAAVSFSHALPKGESAGDLRLWYLKEDGTQERVEHTYGNGMVSFETDHFSIFRLEAGSGGGGGGGGDNAVHYIAAAVAVCAVVAAVAIAVMRGRKA